jgi:hypothetical protein
MLKNAMESGKCSHYALIAGFNLKSFHFPIKRARIDPQLTCRFSSIVLMSSQSFLNRNCIAISAESAYHTSLGQRPRIIAGKNRRAESPIYKA